MDKNINKALLSKILESIPEHISTVTYLMDFLDISQGAVYRRLKGEIPFSFDEIYKLSENLGFSVDEIFDLKRKDRIFFDTKNAPLIHPMLLLLQLKTYTMISSFYQQTEIL